MKKMSDYFKCGRVISHRRFLENINKSMAECYNCSRKEHWSYKYLEIEIDNRYMIDYIRKKEFKLPMLINDTIYIDEFDGIISAHYRCFYCGSYMCQCHIKNSKTGSFDFYGCPQYRFEKYIKPIDLRKEEIIVQDLENPKFGRIKWTKSGNDSYVLLTKEWSSEKENLTRLQINMTISKCNVIPINNAL